MTIPLWAVLTGVYLIILSVVLWKASRPIGGNDMMGIGCQMQGMLGCIGVLAATVIYLVLLLIIIAA